MTSYTVRQCGRTSTQIKGGVTGAPGPAGPEGPAGPPGTGTADFDSILTDLGGNVMVDSEGNVITNGTA